MVSFQMVVLAIVSVMLAVNYAFSGTELIGIAAGETDNPKEAVPRAIKTTIGRLVIFFVLDHCGLGFASSNERSRGIFSTFR